MTVDRPPEPQFDESPPDPVEATSPEAIRLAGGAGAPAVREGRISGGGTRRPADQSILDIARSQTEQRFTPSLNRQRVQAAVAFHLGGKLRGVEWTGAVDPIANRFMEMAANNPSLVGLLEEDVNTLFALTDEDIAARISRGEPVSQLGDVYDAIAEVSWEVGATDLAARFNAEQADAMSGTFDALTSTEALQLALEGAEAPAPGQRFAVPTAKAASFQRVFDLPGAWSFSPSERTLAVTVGGQTIGVNTRPGFDPQNHLDVMAEVVSAQADGRIRGGELTGGQKGGAVERIIGAAHEIGHWLDEHPGVRTTIDSIWQATLEGHAFGDEPGPIERASDAMRDEKGAMTETAIRQASILPFPEDAVMATIARLFVEESEGQFTSKDALALAAETVAENREQLVSEYQSLTSEELLEELQTDIEGESALGGAIESGMGKVLDVMDGWDRFTQWVGVNVLDVVGDYLSATDAISSGDWEEGFTRFKDMMETQPSGTTAAEYFGLEGTAADAANLAVGIGFDPLNLVFPGGKGIRQIAQRALTQPKYAGIYLRMGQFPHIARQIAQGSEVKAGLGVLGMSGLDDPEILDLIRLARDPDATVGQVNEVWTRAMHKDWLGEGPMRAIRHSTIEGLGRALDSLAGGRLSQEHLGDLMQMFSKLSVGRTFRLGENRAMDEFADLLVQFYPADSEKALDWFYRAAEARASSGDDMALAGASAAVKEQARRAVWETGGTSRAVQRADDIGGVNQNLRSVEDALSRLHLEGFDDATEAAVRTELNRMHSIMARRADEARPGLQRTREKRRLAHTQLRKATALEADQAANAARNVMAEQVYRLYDEIATDLNAQFGREVIPVVKGKVNPFAVDVPVRDWSEVTGMRKVIAGDDPDLSLMMGLAVDDAEMARQANAIGMFNRSQKVLLPASPYEVLLFRKVGHDQGLLQSAMQALRSERMKKWTRVVRLGFAFNLLINPLTAGKVTLDETLRFLATTGEAAKFGRATLAGLPGLGRASEALASKVRMIGATGGDAISNPWAQAYRRNVGGWSPDDFAGFGWVERPPRRTPLGEFSRAEYREQVERWINGSLLQDRRFREYARWIDAADTLEDGTKIPPPEFVAWWDNGVGTSRPGRADTKTVTVRVRDQATLGTELTAADAFNILDRVFDNWLELLVDESARPLMREQLLAAARGSRGGLDVVKDARLLNAISQVPGLSSQKRLGSGVFNAFFGAPSGRRAGVFYEHFFDEAMGLLKARHGDRVLTVDRLMDFASVDRGTAEFWLKQGSDNAVVAQLIAETGARTEGQLAARAAAYAERRTDDLMYRFTASSIAGRGVEAGLIMPFARAQADFLSWWSDHLTRPMTVRLSMEQRQRMPSLVRRLTEGVESIPLNVRALSKYAHLVAAVNNEHESVVDQTIDNLTFLPVRFDSEVLIDAQPGAALLTKLTPQLGPVPSWLFDLMVDKGVISEEVEAQIEALFPALGYTDYDSDNLIDRFLPTSRRSIRDFSVGSMRWAYGLVGQDVHTDPGAAGVIANGIADNKLPFATSDFQIALAADFLRDNVWDVVPGSAEWDSAVRELAVGGAAEANRNEWGQDWLDRVYPLAEYGQEARALRAYEGLLDEQRFQAMTDAGLFQANDLQEVEGVPRIQAVWDRYVAGQAEPEELEWLDDRLRTIYFETGRVDVLPGFSYRDYLHLTNPELAVNLIAKREDSGIPVRSEEHAEFKQKYINALTGRTQNIPPGDTGTELIRQAWDRGWITATPVEEWATDASQAVYKSGQRALRGVWEHVSHRTWQQGLKKSIETKRFTLGEREALILEAAGVDVDAGTEYTYAEFHRLLDDFDERFDIAQPTIADRLERGAVHGQLARHQDEFGAGLLENLAEADREFSKLGIESIEDWPEASKAEVRRLFNEAITLGHTTVADYAQEIEPLFGPIDFQPPTPPPVEDLETGIVLSGEELADLEVIDGDTVSIMLDDGPLRVRLVGINAPEVSQPGYAEARTMLEEVVADASEVVFGVYRPELFGLTQLSAPGEQRLLAFIYVNGVPLFDPSVFTAANPRGSGLGGTVIDLKAILEAGMQGGSQPSS